MSFQLSLTVNGSPVSATVDERTLLVDFLRNELALTGTHVGCDTAQCGACTVHVDGQPVRACVTPVSVVGDRKVRTIEGLSPDGTHPIQRAWAEADVVQCGYCQSGQIMTAAALLDQRPDPTDDDIDAALAGNLCRCGTYCRIRDAVHLAAKLTRGGAK